MERNRILEMKQADRLRKFIRKVKWEITEMTLDRDDFVMSRKEFRLLLERRSDLNEKFNHCNNLIHRAERLLWKVA